LLKEQGVLRGLEPATSFSFSCSWSTASSAMVEAAPATLGSPLTEIRTPPPAAPETDSKVFLVRSQNFFSCLEFLESGGI
jgi:hypothetical protein